MERQPTVVFRNVGQLYFPQTRVECHYSLKADHRWDSSDWVGIFQVQLALQHEAHGTNEKCFCLVNLGLFHHRRALP